MLSRSSKINSSSVIQSPGSVQPLEEYISKLQTPAVFPSLENEQADGEEKNAEQQEEQNKQPVHLQKLELLVPRKNFHEMFSNFFIQGHKQLLVLQAKIRRRRGLSGSSVLSLYDVDKHQVQSLRRQYYQLQMILFKMSKGDNHNSKV